MDGQGELEFFTPGGELIRLTARFERERQVPGRERVAARHIVAGQGWRVRQYRLPGSASRDQRAREALERETGAALAVERAHGAEPYAQVFTRLVGHNLDAAEPYVLYDVPAAPAEPLAHRKGTLGVEQLRSVLAQLILAVRLLEDVGFVHRALTPDTVRWDGRTVRVAELYGAIPAGAPREAFGQAPWAAPEQRKGTGAADPRDDVWSVAQLTYYLLAGRLSDGMGPPQDLDGYRQLTALRDSGAFAGTAADRAHAADVLRLLNRHDPLGGLVRAADPLDAGRDEFDRLVAEKRRALGRGPGAVDDGPPPHGAGGAREPLPGSRDADPPEPVRPARRRLRVRRNGADGGRTGDGR